MLRDLKNNGFASIVEVIVTTVVFVLATAGILSTVAMLKPEETETTQKIEAAYIAKGILDDLRKQVDAITWDDAGSNLAVGVPHEINFGDYFINYTVTEPIADLRYVNMTITWPDF